MKKILTLLLVVGLASCSNPEDKAASDKDPSRFNSSTENTLNTPAGPTAPAGRTDSLGTDSTRHLDTSGH